MEFSSANEVRYPPHFGYCLLFSVTENRQKRVNIYHALFFPFKMMENNTAGTFSACFNNIAEWTKAYFSVMAHS